MQIKNSQPLVVTYWNGSQKKCTTLIFVVKALAGLVLLILCDRSSKNAVA